MPVAGIRRYIRLWKHIANPGEYAFRKGDRRKRNLQFITRPLPVRFDVPDSLYQVFKELFMADVYEIDALVGALPPEPVVVDVGANAGFFAIQLLSKVERARVFAYEPMPANVNALRQTIQQNPRLQESIQLFPVAVTGQPLDSLDLFAEAEEKSQVVASAFAGFNPNNTQKITVPCVTLTDILLQNNLNAVDLLKVDCEGSEYDILYQTAPELIRRIRRIVVEVHDLDGEQNNLMALNGYVRSLGYATTHQPINAFCHALEAVRQEVVQQSKP